MLLILAAILYLPFEIQTKKFGFPMVNSRWPPKSPDLKWVIKDGCQKVWISNGKFKMAAKNNLLDIFGWFSNVIYKPTYSPPFEIRTRLEIRSSLYAILY